MAILHPCLHCHRKHNCEKRQQTLKSIRGLGVTKASIRCRVPQDDYPAGTVVAVEAFEIDDDGACYTQRKYTVTKRGVVARWRNGKATVALDKAEEISVPDGGHNIGYLHLTPDRLTKIDGSIREICKCGLTQERCDNRDYPSIRNGEWSCFQEVLDRDAIRRAEVDAIISRLSRTA